MRPLILFLLPLSSLFAQTAPQHETVVVTGTYEPLSIDEIDRALTLLPVRSNSLLLGTLVDALRLDPSLDLQSRGADGIQTDLSIRGSGFEQTLVLLNGQRMNDVQSGHHDMDIPVPLDAVTRVEVLRGSGSTMYGSDAAGGVINIITAPPEGLEFRLKTAIGNFGTNQESGSISDTFGRISEQLTFARDFSTGFMPDRDYRNLQLASGTQLLSAWGVTSVTLAYMDHPFGANQFYGAYPSWEDTKTWWAGVQQAFGKKTTASFAYRRHSDLFVLFRDSPEIYTNHHADETYQAAVRRTETLAPSVSLFYGVDALHESIVSNNLGNHARSRAAAYVAIDFRALKRFSLSISGREEIYHSFAGTFSPTIAGGAWITGKLKLRASASRAFRIPTYTDLYYQDPANQGNPNLRPERAWTYEAGLDWRPAPRVRADVTIFERRERDDIDYFRTSPTALWQALNIDSLNFTGVESGIGVNLRRGGTVDLRYTWLLGSQNTIPLGETKYSFNYPTDSGVIAWQASLMQHFLLRSRIGVLNRRARDPYALWDFSAAWDKGSIHPFVRLANITATRYEEIQGVAMPGRTVVGGVEFLVHAH